MRRSAYYSRTGGYSRSYNAEQAEAEGRFPISRAAKIVAENAECTIAFARKCLDRIGSSEWHHVGKYAARVYYYETEKAVRMARLFFGCERRATIRTRRQATYADAAWSEHHARMTARQLAETERVQKVEHRLVRFVSFIVSEEQWLRLVEDWYQVRSLLAEIDRSPTPARLSEAARRGLLCLTKQPRSSKASVIAEVVIEDCPAPEYI